MVEIKPSEEIMLVIPKQGKLLFKVAFLSISNINQSPCSTLNWVWYESIRIDWVLYEHHGEFPINKKIIPMLACPILQ